jgi:SAM-dependent methyltransferase
MKLKNDDNLEQSAVVANCRMNRERGLTGSNSYAKELGFHPLEFLKELKCSGRAPAWLDLCCGSGKALIEAAQRCEVADRPAAIEFVGVDLAGLFAAAGSFPSSLRLEEASLRSWTPARSFDLITCVHGLHYVGDKLGLIERATSWLTPTGVFAANLDTANLKLSDGGLAGRRAMAQLKRSGIHYDRKRRLIVRHGKVVVKFPWRYLGADDQAGPNYTGQPAVDSYYEIMSPSHLPAE